MTRTAPVVLLALLLGATAGWVVGSMRPAPVPPAAAPRGPDLTGGRVVPEVVMPVAGDAIRGRVRTERGAPLAGLRLIAGGVATVSGPDGSFEIGGLAAGQYELRSERPDLDLAGAAASPGQTVELTARELFAVAIRVARPDGTGAETARVRCRGLGRQDDEWSRDWRPAAPRLLIPEGWFELTAVAGPNGEPASETVAILVLRGRETPPVDLLLRTLRGIRGRVVLPEGWSAEQLGVQAGEWWSRAGPVTCWRYALRGLPPGAHAVEVRDGLLVFCRVVVTVGAGVTEQDLVVPSELPAGTCSLRAEGPDGRLVSSLVEYGGSMRLPDGTLVFRPCSPGEPDVVTARGFGSRKAVPDPATGGYRVRFEEPAFLDLTVESGEADLSVAVHACEAGEDRWPQRASLSSKRARLGPFQPGRYRVVEDKGRAEEAHIELCPGENRLALRPATGVLEVILPEGTGELSLSCRQVRGSCTRSGKGPPGGTITFEGLQPGQYTLTCQGPTPALGSMVVTVPATGPVPFAVPVVTALRIRIEDPPGAFARAGLRAGDLIVAIEGKTFRTAEEASAILTLAASRDAATITIRRGEEEFVVTLPGAELDGSEDLGEWFDPVER
jgi:hypothetical protein